MNDEPELIGPREAARLLGVHENTVRNWANKGLLTATPLIPGHRYHRYPRTEVLALARSLRRQRLLELAAHYWDDWVVAEVIRDLAVAGLSLGDIVLVDWDHQVPRNDAITWLNVYVPSTNKIEAVPRFHLRRLMQAGSPVPAG